MSSLYKIQMFRFIEVGLKRVLFHLAKATTQHKIYFQVNFFILLNNKKLFYFIFIHFFLCLSYCQSF